MKKNQEIDWDYLLGYASHNLKSPLVSVKAMLFILSRSSNKKNKLETIEKIDQKLNLLNLRIDEIIQFLSLFTNNESPVQFFGLGNELKKIIKKNNLVGKIKFKSSDEMQIVGHKESLLNSLETILKRVAEITDGSFKVELIRSNHIKISFRSNKEVFPDSKEEKENWLKLFIARKNLNNQNVSISLITKKKVTELNFKIPAKPTKKTSYKNFNLLLSDI